jgi:hypothetical protein
MAAYFVGLDVAFNLPVRQEFARRVPPGMAAQVRLEMAPLGEDGIAIGAARLAMLARA